MIYSASAPGFTRSRRAGEAVDVSFSSRTPTERFDMEEQRFLAAGSGFEEDDEGLLTGKS